MGSKRERPRIVLVNRCILTRDDGLYLLIQRAATDSHSAGLWEFPGGKLDMGQDLRHALEREVLEETGLLVEQVSRLVYADSYILTSKAYSGLPYVVLFSQGRVVGGSLKLSSEHMDSAWVSYEEALEYDLAPESRAAIIALKGNVLT